MDTQFLRMLSGLIARHVISGIGCALAAHGLPTFSNATVTNLVEVFSGLTMAAISIGWSAWQKKRALKQMNHQATIGPKILEPI